MAKKTETEIITTYNGRKIAFYPNSHRYKYEGESKFLVSPSSVTGILDKSNQLLIWNDRLITEFFTKELISATDQPKTFVDWEVQKLVEDALKLRTTAKETAAEIGDIIHDYAEKTAWARTMGEALPEIPDMEIENDEDRAKHEQVIAGIEAFIRFETENNIVYIDSERFVYSESHGVPYVGRFDAVLDFNGVTVLCDYKSSKGVYSSQYYQLAGYDLAMQEEHTALRKQLPYEAIGVLHFDKKTAIPTMHILTEEDRALAQRGFLGLLQVKDTERSLNIYA